MSSRDTGRGLTNFAAATISTAFGMSALLHAEALQSGRQADPDIEIVKTLAGVLGAERAGDQLHGARRGLGVERDGVGREDRVAVRMIEPERLPHALRQRMLDAGLGAERGGEPGAVQRVGARGDVVRAGRPRAAGSTPSSATALAASPSTTGLMSGPYSVSTACAMAFMPLAAEMRGGSDSVRSGS